MTPKRLPIYLLLTLAAALSGCTFSLITLPTPPPVTAPPPETPLPTPTPVPQAEITFQVLVPDDTPAGASLALEIVDEVTGIDLNPQRVPMTREGDLIYSVRLAFPLHSVVHYRYVRTAPSPAPEASPLGEVVRYRLAVVQGPGTVEDRVARWSDGGYAAGTGALSGQVQDAESGQPIGGLMIVAGGRRTFTRADGSFRLHGLPPGKHNLVVYDPNGRYAPFQQGAVIAEGMETPATLSLQRAATVQITFHVQPPPNHLSGAPIRLAGNLYALGNTLASLGAGESTLASRMPILQPAGDGTYALTLSLPAGADVRYKYTLGDGFWNAEHTADGAFRVRQLIVPDSDTVVNDRIESWGNGQAAPIFFDVHILADTSPGDFVSLQLNPGLWTAPIPMWPLGASHWGFQLYGPMELMHNFHYRYCRNDLCDWSAEATQSGPNALGHYVETKRTTQRLVDTVSAWQHWPSAPPQAVVQTGAIQPRPADFVRGVTLLPAYHPTWQRNIPPALRTIAGYDANTVILAPTWTFTFHDPLVFDPQPGEDMLWADLQATLDAAQAAGLDVVLFPQPRFAGGATVWWQKAPRDATWWNAWFEAYTAFALHHATLAAQRHLKRLVLGGAAVAPALPNGLLPDGSPANTPPDAAQRWRNLLAEVHNRFPGEVWWAMPMPADPTATPPFMDQIDGLYIQFRLPLSTNPTASIAEMQAEAERLLDGLVLPFQVHADRPLWLALAYPSAEGGASGCVPAHQGRCLSPESPQAADQVAVNLDTQTNAYNALFLAVNDRDWLAGLIAEGFFPAAPLQDASPSIYGKPAAEVLRYWFQHWR